MEEVQEGLTGGMGGMGEAWAAGGWWWVGGDGYDWGEDVRVCCREALMRDMAYRVPHR